MKATIQDKHGNTLNIDGNTATLNGQPVATKIQPRANGTSFYINFNGSTISFGNLTSEQANAINNYNATRTATRNSTTRNVKGFVHTSNYATVAEMLADTMAPLAVVKMRSVVNARKVSKECFLREAQLKVKQAQKELDELASVWEKANKVKEEKFNKELEALRVECNKQFTIERASKLNKTELQALLVELLTK